MKTDRIVISEMELACRIGTTEQERAFPQILRVSLEIFLPLARAGETDSLSDTIDYADIIQKIRTHTSARAYTLAETVAEDIARIALAPDRANSVSVQVKKKVFEAIQSVGVAIYREKKPA